MTPPKRSRPVAVPAIFVSVPSAQADRTQAALLATGLSITRADNICVAEMYAETQQFAAAIYDQSLSPEEQVSLARVMRIRWPWMRILRLVSPGAHGMDDDLFDCSALSDAQLAHWIEQSLAG